MDFIAKLEEIYNQNEYTDRSFEISDELIEDFKVAIEKSSVSSRFKGLRYLMISPKFEQCRSYINELSLVILSNCIKSNDIRSLRLMLDYFATTKEFSITTLREIFSRSALRADLECTRILFQYLKTNCEFDWLRDIFFSVLRSPKFEDGWCHLETARLLHGFAIDLCNGNPTYEVQESDLLEYKINSKENFYTS
ncbi:hypothetical protein HK096_010888, partial [Nowakowskiella sp. JEL0078]